MSKVGKKELKIPPNVKVNIIENLIEISSKLGKVSHEVNSKFCLELTKTSQIKIKPQIGNNSYLNKEIKSLWGTEHRLLKNHLEGLEINRSKTNKVMYRTIRYDESKTNIRTTRSGRSI